MTAIKILCPTGHLAFTPLEKGSFLLGCEQKPDFIIADAGSCDMGPRPLGADQHVSLAAWQRHDLEVMLVQARKLGVPMIVGSASDTGTDRGVDQFVGMIRDIAAEHRLAPFKLTAIYAEQSIDELKRKLAGGARIEGLDGRPDADLATLGRTTRVVAVMNAEPIRAALAGGADVVIAGRSSDCALFAAPLLDAGFSPGISYYTGKLMECASFCAEPYMGKESILGRVEGEAVCVTAMHPGQRCTPASLGSHAMYERTNPFREDVAGGHIDMTNCRYEQVDPKTTRASGQVFVKAPTVKVKLEGAGKVGERRLAVIGIRDPHTIQLIDKAIAWAKGKVAERFGPIGEGYDVFYHLYGRNAVMKDLDPAPEMKPHELGIVVEAIHRDGEKAAEIAALAARNMFYARLPETKGTAGAAALMSDEILIGEAAYEWTLNHVIEVKNAMELFRTRTMTVDGSGLKEAV
ncbi:MAG: acyclic terpene utilization AtuA family protein [Alphaproteobacteria bacterium]|nr:acyclic terpene utilization AtuA family protein [Alphaproteobacteria bacterium]